MTPKEKTDSFLALSSALTGVKIDSTDRAAKQLGKPGDLFPRNTPIPLHGEYMRTVEERSDNPSILTELLQQFTALQVPRADGASLSPKQAAGKLLADNQYGPLCRSIMKLWFLGVWYDPQHPSSPVAVISSQAYKEALVWKVMQAHPQGYSMWAFGHWEQPPPSLEAFISIV